MNSSLRSTIRFLFPLSFFFFTFFQPAYCQDWIHGIKATGSDQSSGMYDDSDMVVDGKGNMVIAGQYNNSLSLGEHTIVTDDGFYPDIFLCRIRADYTVEWLKHIEVGFNNGEEIAVSVDDDSNIYLTGTQDGKIFVSKYDSTGYLVWNTDFGDEAQGYGTSISTDLFDNVYVSGGSGWNFFVAKLSHLGEIIWVKDIWVNYSAGCTVSDLAVDPSGNVYFAGKFEIDLPLDDITLTYNNSWGPSVFWGKMDTNGDFIWAKSGSGRSTDKVSLELTSGGDLFLVGGVSGSGIGLGGYTVPRGNCCNGATSFIAKSDLDGNILWAKGGTENYYGSSPLDIQVDYMGSLYLTGSYFTCYGTFCTEGDYYVEKYDTDGTPIWRKDYASGDTEATKAIDVDNNGLLYQLGVNSSPTFIDPNEWTPIRTYGIGILDTESTTYKRTPRPIAERFAMICEGDDEFESGSLIKIATGANIRWYTDPTLSNKVADGNEFAMSTKRSDTLYVTQTVNGIESWPMPVIVNLVVLPDDDLTFENDSIRAPLKDGISYQWLYNGTPIEAATKYFVKVDSTQNYEKFSVLISEDDCQKLLTNIQVITGVDDGETSPRIICYPNPTSSMITIRVPDASIISHVLVRNVLGKEIIAPLTSAQNNYIFDLTDQPPGLYFVELAENKKRSVLRVVKL